MPTPLHLDSNLTPAQQEFVAGIPPNRTKAGRSLLGISLAAASAIAAISLVGWATSPATFPLAAFRFGVFYAWFEVVVGSTLAAVMLALNLVMAAAIGHAADKAKEELLAIKFRNDCRSMIAASRNHSPFNSALRFASRMATVGIVVGLAMNGFVFLPIAVAMAWMFGWFSRWCSRLVEVGVVRFLCPDEEDRAGDTAKVAA